MLLSYCLRNTRIGLVKTSNCNSKINIRRMNYNFSTQRLPSLQVQQIKKLETEANINRHDSSKQKKYLEKLSRINPEEVIRRFESRRFRHDDKCVVEYLNSLKKTKQMHRMDKQIMKESTANSRTNIGESFLESNSTNSTHYPHTGGGQPHNKSLPLEASVIEKKSGSSRFITYVLIALLVYPVAKSIIQPIVENEVKPKQEKDVTYEPIKDIKIKFEDVKGCDEPKHELEDIVQYLRDPTEFTRMGGKLPRGVLLMGPPGTGKTLLAKAVAGEASVPFFYASGSQFEDMFAGTGAARIRKLFEKAKEQAPCIIFIDEIDGLGGRRGKGDASWSRQTLNQLLAEMDGFGSNDEVIIIAATNIPEALDSALIRPGRFDVKVKVGLPDAKGRKEILDLYLTKVKSDPSIDSTILARTIPGLSGADIFNLINSAAIKASKDDGAECISMDHIEWAKDKILMGTEKPNKIIPRRVLEATAYHEGGHALVALLTKGAMPIHKGTILGRGMTGGHVSYLPISELSQNRTQMLAYLDTAMGGRVAEELVFGKHLVSTGASSDLEQATKVARHMVTECGMSDLVGPVHYASLDKSDLAPETQSLIDDEVERLLKESYTRVTKLLKEKEREHHRIAQALLEYETLDGQELVLAMKGKLDKKKEVNNDVKLV